MTTIGFSFTKMNVERKKLVKGGISINNIREYAETGVDFISVGALTHQIKSLDLSLTALH